MSVGETIDTFLADEGPKLEKSNPCNYGFFTCTIKPRTHATKVSLTSSLVALLSRVYNEQVFPLNLSLTSLICSCVWLDKS